VRVTTVQGKAFTDLGQGLAGAHGEPLLTGKGTLLPHTPLQLGLSAAREHAPAWLVAGFAQLGAPLFGGTLVPDPAAPGLVIPLVTGAAGAITLNASWPPAMPADVELFLQARVQDPAGPQGFAASNAPLGSTP